MKIQSSDTAKRQQRRREAIRLHEIEGNPFTQQDDALFAMFDREGWTDKQRRAHLIKEAKLRTDILAAVE